MVHPKASTPDSSPNDRLNSWKEIAGHLRVSVRTAQRWEAVEGLPVRRHKHAVLGTVYAHPGELDAWLGKRTDRQPEQTREAKPESNKGRAHLPRASIAVLPFENLDRNQESEIIADGLTEDLITTLSQIGHLKVVARTSVYYFKGRPIDVRQVARDLGVETILEGSVRRTGKRLRVTAQLINAQDGCHLWAKRFDREIRDLFDLQDELCRAITQGLHVRLAPRATILQRRTGNQAAYDRYLTGRHFWNQRTRDGLEKAIDCYRQSIDLEPGFAPAHAGLADCHVFLWIYGGFPWVDALANAEAAAREALRLDENLGDAHTSMGLIGVSRLEFKRALGAFERALELNPNDVRAGHWSAMVKAQSGRADEAIEQISNALELDRFGVTLNQDLGRILYFARRYDEAISQLEHTLKIAPNAPCAPFYLGLAHLMRGNPDQALALFKDDPDLRAFALGVAGKPGEARKRLRRKQQGKPNHTRTALLHFCLGDHEAAAGSLRRANENHEPEFIELCARAQPLFDPLRPLPAFRALPPR